MFKLLEDAVEPFPNQVVEQPPASLLAFIWHFTKPFKFLLSVLFITSAIIAAIEVYMLSAIGQLIDWMQAGDQNTFFQVHGTSLTGMLVLILLIWPLLHWVDSMVENQGLLGNFAMQIRWRAHRYLLRQSNDFFANDFSGRIATKVMQTALSLRDSVVSVNGLMVYVGVYFSSSAVIFMSSDWRLVIPLLMWLCAYIAVMRLFLPALKQVSTEQSDARSIMTGRVVDAYTNIQTVKMFSTNNDEEQYAKYSMQQMLSSVHRQMRLVTRLNTTLILINAVLICSTMGFATWLWSQSIVSTGAVAVAGALTMRIQSMAQWFIWELARLFEAIGTTQDGMDTIAQPRSVADVPSAGILAVPYGEIEFENITFSYPQQSAVFDHFSLDIKPGERIGLVGSSGAGKSTLVSLLLRLYDLKNGSIRIDQQNIAEVTEESLRQNIAIVTQDTSLLHRTIGENIAYGRPDASEHQILRAVKLAKADSFIFDLIDNEGNRGLKAKVGERGVKLSGGQRQRIAIARVILKNAPILVLDEATSALDSEVEAAIQEQFELLMKGKTVLAIAHRLSTIAQMDRLIVLDHGRIVEQGPHKELLEKNGVYARFWRRQSGGFIN